MWQHWWHLILPNWGINEWGKVRIGDSNWKQKTKKNKICFEKEKRSICVKLLKLDQVIKLTNEIYFNEMFQIGQRNFLIVPIEPLKEL